MIFDLDNIKTTCVLAVAAGAGISWFSSTYIYPKIKTLFVKTIPTECDVFQITPAAKLIEPYCSTYPELFVSKTSRLLMPENYMAINFGEFIKSNDPNTTKLSNVMLELMQHKLSAMRGSFLQFYEDIIFNKIYFFNFTDLVTEAIKHILGL